MTTSAVIQARVNECTGVNLPPDQRTREQQFALANIMSVISITSETDFNTRMLKGPLNLNNLTDAILCGRNAFHSLDVVFNRSSDDDALNAGVLRYAADRRAVRRLIKDGEPTGAVSTPVVTMHAEDDERAWPESESGYKDTFTRAGTDDQLLQMFTTSGGHCGYSVAEFRAVFQNLMLWLNSGIKPRPSDVAGSYVGTA